MTNTFDIVVIGSGLGGLVTGLLLARSGKKVAIIEKNSQFGGNLQTFVRDKTIFDSGVHYIGGLAPQQNLWRYWTQLGIIKDLKLQKMDEDGFDRISFGEDSKSYPQAQGHANFVAQLAAEFPEQREALNRYIQTVQHYCEQFPLYNLQPNNNYNSEAMSTSVHEVLDDIISDKKLKSILLGNGFLYGLHKDSPFYQHALIINSYISSSYRCIGGGSQISKALTKKLREHGAVLYNRLPATGLEFDGEHLSAVLTPKQRISAQQFVSNIAPHQLFAMFPPSLTNKPSIKRMLKLHDGPSVFSVHLTLTKNSIPYFNHNIYHFDEIEDTWDYHHTWNTDEPKMILISASAKKPKDQFCDSISLLTYMDAARTNAWSNSHNTTTHPNDRGEYYQQFKDSMAEKLLCKAERQIPGLRKNTVSVYTSTPLSYRDYIGTSQGSMYGYEKQASNPMLTLISPKTKVNNLFLTGQNVRLHGLLGVTITGFMTAAEILGDSVWEFAAPQPE